ncbi:hypothetical protein D3C85_932200 [compost metagenome]
MNFPLAGSTGITNVDCDLNAVMGSGSEDDVRTNGFAGVDHGPNIESATLNLFSFGDHPVAPEVIM